MRHENEATDNERRDTATQGDYPKMMIKRKKFSNRSKVYLLKAHWDGSSVHIKRNSLGIFSTAKRGVWKEKQYNRKK